MSDYHLHLHPHEPSLDGPPPGEYPPGLIESYVEAAAERGVGELGFTEHLYRCVEAAPVLGRFWESDPNPDLAAQTAAFVFADQNLGLESYVEAVLSARDEGLPVRLGLEVDFFPETYAAVLELIDPYPWDFLLGSVHWVGGWAIDSAEVTFEFERRGVDRAWHEYFELVTELAATGGVDVLAHVDVCKKYGYRPADEPVEAYAAVIEAAVSTGTAVEVSSQGLRNPAAEVYPSPRFLRMCCEAGIAVTLGSDAHRAEQVAHATERVRAAAAAAGYTSHLRFDQRRRREVPLWMPGNRPVTTDPAA